MSLEINELQVSKLNLSPIKIFAILNVEGYLIISSYITAVAPEVFTFVYLKQSFVHKTRANWRKRKDKKR